MSGPGAVEASVEAPAEVPQSPRGPCAMTVPPAQPTPAGSTAPPAGPTFYVTTAIPYVNGDPHLHRAGPDRVRTPVPVFPRLG